MGEILSFFWEANARDRILTDAWCTNEIRLGVQHSDDNFLISFFCVEGPLGAVGRLESLH